MEEFEGFLMEKIELLKNRRSELLAAGSEIREKINGVIDSESFVELSTYSFSKNEFYGETAEGEGVVTGFATIEGNPVYIVAQNGRVLSGGISKANCDKICKTLISAQNNSTPVLYFLDTKGVQIGEGVTVLEGIADVLYEMSELRGNVLQFAVVDGDCFGAFSLIAAACDFTFYTKKTCVAYASPAVIGAGDKCQMTKYDIGGVKSNEKTRIADFIVENMSEIKATISDILNIFPDTGYLVSDNDDDLNRSCPALNENVCANCLKEAVFDNETFIEFGKTYVPEVVCGIGRVGGISVGSIIFGGGEDGVSLNPAVIDKINNFVLLLADYNIPLVNFVNTKGIDTDFAVSQTTILKDISNLIYNIKDLTKISVVYGKAIGLGYSLFVAKAMGYDYSYSFCNARISLFDTLEGAHIEYDGVRIDNEQAFAAKYSEENQDPFNTAKGGFIDNIIEPQFVRQYLIASLQMLVR